VRILERAARPCGPSHASIPLLGASTAAVGSRASSRTAAHRPGVGRSSRTTTTAPPPRALAAESSCGLDGGARREAGLLVVASRPPPSPSRAARGGALAAEQDGGSWRSRSTRAESLGPRVVGLSPPAGRPPSRQISRELEASFFSPLQTVFLHFSPPGTGCRPWCGWSYIERLQLD
jgi:hypothetical protein